MQWRYHNSKSSEHLHRIRAQSGFSDLPMLEKIVLDFEMHYRLQAEFDMVVRGGMAALLHAGDPIQRISEDIDVLTAVPKPKIVSIIGRLKEDFGEVEIGIEGEPTRLPGHLIHCNIKCPSSVVKGTCSVKVDILCGVDQCMLSQAQTLKSARLGGMTLDHGISVLSRGALIADKMCTLTSAKTMGLRGPRNFPKQIFDIAMMLRGTDLDGVKTFLAAYPDFVSFMLRMHGIASTTRDLIDSTHDRCVSLFDFREGVLLSPEYQKFYTRFQSRYVKNRRVHTEVHHVEEILLAILCARHLQEHAADGDLNGHSKEIHDAICGYVQVRDAGGSPTPNLGALARISETHPNLAGLRAPLTQAQWMLLLEAFAPLLA